VTSKVALSAIKKVIRETSKPSWLNTVPLDFGDSRTGTLKADEWRAFATIYIPVALIPLWGENPMLAAALHNTMELVQVLWLSCYRATTEYRLKKVQQHLRSYLSKLSEIYPDASPSGNQHMALHLPYFMELFGPVHAWWTYPFERLIGHLQQIPTNNKFGEETNISPTRN
jgi:hypothetical protein